MCARVWIVARARAQGVGARARARARGSVRGRVRACGHADTARFLCASVLFSVCAGWLRTGVRAACVSVAMRVPYTCGIWRGLSSLSRSKSRPRSRWEHRRLPMISADLADPLSVSNLKDHLDAHHGNPHIIVNAAGGVCNKVGTSLEKVEPSGCKTIFAANVDSALHLAQFFVPAMKANRWGSVITINSGARLRPSLTLTLLIQQQNTP